MTLTDCITRYFTEVKPARADRVGAASDRTARCTAGSGLARSDRGIEAMSTSGSGGFSGCGKRKAELAHQPLEEGKRQVSERRQQLVLCTSGVYGEDYQRCQQACSVLGARLVSDWSDSVTHLVMLKMSWTPKFLAALASLRPIVNLQWIAQASEAGPTGQLPNVCDPQFAPIASGPSTEGVAVVRPERAALFRGRKYMALPGSDLSDTTKLLEKMGATCESWPTSLETDPGSFVAERAASGWHFLSPGDEKWPTSDEAKAAVAAGADLISPLLVRTSLIMAKRASVMQIQRSKAVEEHLK